MEKMPYRAGMDPSLPIRTKPVAATDWRLALPTLRGQQVVLRELRATDAPSLFALLTTEEVSRFISPPPTSVDGFEAIAWTHRQRTLGTYTCFAVTLHGYDTAIGIFQVREMSAGFDQAEWGFTIGTAFWGTGVFQESAELVLAFTFETLPRCSAPPRGARGRV